MFLIGREQFFAFFYEGVIVGKGFGMAGIRIQIEDGLLNGKVDGTQLFALTATVAMLILIHIHICNQTLAYIMRRAQPSFPPN